MDRAKAGVGYSLVYPDGLTYIVIQVSDYYIYAACVQKGIKTFNREEYVKAFKNKEFIVKPAYFIDHKYLEPSKPLLSGEEKARVNAAWKKQIKELKDERWRKTKIALCAEEIKALGRIKRANKPKKPFPDMYFLVKNRVGRSCYSFFGRIIRQNKSWLFVEDKYGETFFIKKIDVAKAEKIEELSKLSKMLRRLGGA